MQYQYSSLFLFDYQMKRGGFVNIPYVFRKCTKCGEWLVANNSYFSKNKCGKYGLQSKCKRCDNKRRKKYYKENKEKILESCKEYRKNHSEQRKIYQKQYYEEHKDTIKENQKKYYKENKETALKRNKQWKENNLNHMIEYRKKYYQENKEYIAEYHKEYQIKNRKRLNKISKKYYQENRERLLEYSKEYRETPQGQIVKFNSHHKRKVQKKNQGNGITKEQWLDCMKFFEFRCAYSGQVLSKSTRSLDHIKPLNRGGEHEVWNLVPMDRGLNSSKNDNNLLEWYQEQDFYSEDRLQKIYEWQEYAFNKWGDINVTRTIKGNIK